MQWRGDILGNARNIQVANFVPACVPEKWALEIILISRRIGHARGHEISYQVNVYSQERPQFLEHKLPKSSYLLPVFQAHIEHPIG